MKLQDLHKPFDPAKVSWRLGAVDKVGHKGLALAYIDARDVMERLDEVCGPANWQDSYSETPKGRMLCTISIKMDDTWVSKSDGAGDTDVEGDKGAISDAFKRAAVKWGIGRYLYDLDSPWVRAEQKGKSWVIAKGEDDKLRKVLMGHKVTDTASNIANRPEFERLVNRVEQFTSLDDLDAWYNLPETVSAIEALTPNWRYELQQKFLVQGCLIAESHAAAETFWVTYKNMRSLMPDDMLAAIKDMVAMGKQQAA